jgi:short-subunit dehydrogenase
MSTGQSKGTALITGASAGIGATYADRLARRGYDLILVARDEARLSALAAKLSAENGIKAEVLRADLAEKADVAKVEARLRDDPAITMLVNNAGIVTMAGILANQPDEFEKLILVNNVAPTRLATAVASAFVSRGHGAIINLASVLALSPEVIDGNYSATKAYILNFSQSITPVLEPLGVRVQVVMPGATRTEVWERSGIDINLLPPENLLEVGDLVDAALLGFDRGETLTIPPLEQIDQFNEMTQIRQSLQPVLSRDRVATRYRVAQDA